MDTKTFARTLRLILGTLLKLEVRGKDNLGMLLGLISLVEKSLAAIEEEETEAGE